MPPSTPRLIRRSGRIPALPPIKLLHCHCTAVANIAQKQSSTLELWKNTALNPGGLGGQSPSTNCHQECGTFPKDSAGDGRRYRKQIAVSPTHVCTFKCLPRKEIFRMLHPHTADASRISIGTKG